MKCLRPGCKKPRFARGLCAGDYRTAYSLVQRGKTDWSSLERRGKILPVQDRASNYEKGATRWLLDVEEAP